MARRGSGKRRSAKEWAVRLGLAAVAAAIGWSAVTHSLATALRARAPEQAHALAPGDARIAATLAAKWVLDRSDPVKQAEATRLAREALLRDPTVVQAVTTLGLQADLRGDKEAARRLFAYSQILSRRDLTTQIWAIEDAVGRGDIAGALRHYDVALRTNRTAPDLLYPVLADAIGDAAIRAELVRTLAAKPAWGASFVDYVAVGGSDPQATASLFRSLGRTGVPVSARGRTALIGKLMARGEYEDAWAFYASVHPGADRRRSRDPRFTGDAQNPSPFDWFTVNDAGISTTIQRGEQGGIVDFSAPSSIGGPLLRQMQLLPAGRYVLSGRSAGINQPEASRPYWMLACLDGRELGRIILPNSGEGQARFAGQFIVPAACPAQYLSLVARPSDEVSGVSGQIEEAILRPAG
jgi:hypothetical protein